MLTEEVGQVSENLGVYQQSDRELMNFRGNYNHSKFDSPKVAKNNSNSDKEL